MNCEAEIYGRYCHNCGQENIEPKESVWSLITHFLYDITHFDGKFFSTVKYLLIRPGFLSKEYVKGRRASYLHPIKMYVFTSAFFFIIFFSMFTLKERDLGMPSPAFMDSLANGVNEAEAEVLKEVGRKNASRRIRVKNGVTVQGVSYQTLAAYDSAQARLPEAQRHGWYQRMKTRKLIEFSQEINKDPNAFLTNWMNKLLHSFPQLLFVSLPLFALLLKLLYLRKKQFYYADHAIFTIHLYIFTFIALFLLLMLNRFYQSVTWRWIPYLEVALCIYILYYAYKALRNFYQQGQMKTLFKFLLLNFLSFFMILFLFLVFIVLSIYEI